jgi:lipoate-protein ligase A
MGLDEALMEDVARDPSRAVVRVYTWSEPTLSLGYFQDRAEADREERFRGAPLVRRATGGGAIWHHHDVTYALVLPSGHPMASRVADLYRGVHASIAVMLGEAGAEARRRGDDPDRPSRPFLCFLDRDPEDLVVGTSKVVGSAQRRRAGAVLQHGSLLLAKSNVTPELPGLAETAGVELDRDRWAAMVAEAVTRALGLPAERVATMEDRLVGRAHTLANERYGSAEWTDRR